MSLSFLGCHGGTRVRTAPPSATTVLQWAIGVGERGEEPPPGDRYLVVLPTQGRERAAPAAPPKRVFSGCFNAMSFLPAPEPDRRIFFLSDGKLYVGLSTGERPALLEGNDPALGITHLMAFLKRASPLQLLVAAQQPGQIDYHFLVLTIEERTIRSVQPLTQDAGFESREAFFARWETARCAPGGRECLVTSVDPIDRSLSHLDVEPVRSARPHDLPGAPSLPILDAAWTSPHGDGIYLLLPCDRPGSP